MARRVAKVRVEMVKEKSVYCKLQELSTPERAAEFARSLFYTVTEKELTCPAKECLVVCCVDAKCKPLVIEYVSVGTSNASLVGMKEVFMTAMLSNADGIFCFHNHPSGVPLPSIADNLITKKIRAAGELLDIQLRDHIIVGDEGYYSFDEKRISNWKEEAYAQVC